MVVETSNEKLFLENLGALIAESNLNWLRIKAIMGAYVQTVEAQESQLAIEALTPKTINSTRPVQRPLEEKNEEIIETEDEAEEERRTEEAIEEEEKEEPVQGKPKSFKERMLELKKRRGA